MKLNFIGGVIAVLAFAALIVVYSALFTVYQTQQALVASQSVPHWYEVNPNRIFETRGGGAAAAEPSAMRPAPA